jgi:hypothetical protein
MHIFLRKGTKPNRLKECSFSHLLWETKSHRAHECCAVCVCVCVCVFVEYRNVLRRRQTDCRWHSSGAAKDFCSFPPPPLRGQLSGKLNEADAQELETRMADQHCRAELRKLHDECQTQQTQLALQKVRLTDYMQSCASCRSAKRIWKVRKESGKSIICK